VAQASTLVSEADEHVYFGLDAAFRITEHALHAPEFCFVESSRMKVKMFKVYGK
jgi:hypothetical protein